MSRRILIVVGSEEIPTFIRTLIAGLVEKGETVGVMGANMSNALSNIDAVRVNSDFRTFSQFRMIISVIFNFVFSPKVFVKAVGLVDDTENKKKFLKQLFRVLLILKFKPDIVHFQWVNHCRQFKKLITQSEMSFIASLRGRQINILPFINWEVAEDYRIIFPSMYFHAVSNAINEKAVLFKAQKNNGRVIYSPVPEFFLNAYKPEKRIFRTSPLRIISIGRFMWKKGYTYALKAIQILKEQKVPVVYTIVASGEVPEEILYLINYYDMHDVIRIIPGVNYEGIPDLLQEYSLFLLPSVEEGIANVVLESMAVGLPVISTDYGGMTEVIKDNENGWLVPVRSAETMAAAIKNYIEKSDAEVQRIRESAYRTIATSFSGKTQINKFIDFYKWVTEEQ